MSLLHKLGALLRRCELSQQRCERKLEQLEKQVLGLFAELENVHKQRKALQELLFLERPQGCVIDRAALFAFRRRQAVLRRQLQMLDFQQGQLQERQQSLQQEQVVVTEQRRYWLRKNDKYQRWGKIQRHAGRLYQLRQEESEAQERVTWGK